MDLKETVDGSRFVVTVTGRIDALTAPRLEESVRGCVERGVTLLVFDFTGLEYISSAGLRVLLSARKQLLPQGGTVVLIGLRPLVREVFDMTGFSKLFPVYATIEEAG